MSAQPLVSIVMPTFNRLEFLPATIDSVLRQTLPDWELIVADDGSNAQTLDYLESLTRDRRIRLLRLRRSGNAGVARNSGIAAARASFLAFLDSDDLWTPNKLERQLDELRVNTGCGWSYTAFIMIDADGNPLRSERNRQWTPHSGQIFEQTVRTTASIRPSSVLARAALVREVGAFDEAIDCSEDYDLWLRLAFRSPVCVVDEPLISVRRHSSNPKRRAGAPHRARDYSLRKLEACLTGPDQKLLAEERSRNALGLAAALSAHGQLWGSVATILSSASLGWRYSHWWYGAAKELAKTISRSGHRRGAPGTGVHRQRVS
jgi:glycosyltransferase involved in cell wall biosynthesis